MKFTCHNPFNQEQLHSFKALGKKDIKSKLLQSELAYANWKTTTISQRLDFVSSLAKVLINRKEELAKSITLEMGKPISESRLEIEKCATLCAYYIDHASAFLAAKTIADSTKEVFIRYEPIGGILGIMPWNFPFWQVFRFAIPTLIAGNVVLIKHAPNVFGCASIIEELFNEAGFQAGVYQNLIIQEKEVKKIIKNNFIQGVSVTGSVQAGSKIGAIAGKNIKKCITELGGNNAFLVFPDASLSIAAKQAVNSRFSNAGQSCISAKRFIVHESVLLEFQHALAVEMLKLTVGNPMEDGTQIGPLARFDLAKKAKDQLANALHLGAKLLLGGEINGCMVQPTLITDAKPNMQVFEQEVFAPIAAIYSAKSEQEMINLANQSDYGLGINLFSEDVERMKSLVPQFFEGAVFINGIVKSDPALPFGGVKNSGIGRELGEEGIKAFVNVKTVVVENIL